MRNRRRSSNDRSYHYNDGSHNYDNYYPQRRYPDYEDNNNGGSYRESYGGRGDHQEDNYSNERGGWQSDRSGHERDGYGRPRNYNHYDQFGRPDADADRDRVGWAYQRGGPVSARRRRSRNSRQS